MTEPKKMSEVDRLRLENTTLKLINVGTQETMVHLQLKTIAETRVKLTQALEAMKTDLFAKYEFDPTKQTIQDDGTIVNRPASSELSAILGKMAQVHGDSK